MNSRPVSFAALLAGTLARWREAVTVAGAIVVLALALSLVLPPSYRATASFVTTDAGVQLSRLTDLTSQPGIAGIAAELGIGGAKEPSESPLFYVQLLESQELLTRLALSRFSDPRAEVPADSATLIQLLHITTKDSARAVEIALKRLRRTMRAAADLKTNLVGLRVDARWPRLSADIANRAMALVSAFNKEQRVSRARAKREFLGGRVADAQAELRATEDSQRLFYERNRSWENSPGLIVEERRVRRQVETASSLYLSLRQQYEAARIDEVNTTPVITIVDRAVPPRRRQWPQRTLIVVTAALFGTALGLLWAAARELLADWAERNPADAGLLRMAAARMAGEVRGTLPTRRRVSASRP